MKSRVGAAEALARQHVGDARRVGRQRLGGDPALGLVEGDHLLRAEERVARRHLGRAPGRRRRRTAPWARSPSAGAARRRRGGRRAVARRSRRRSRRSRRRRRRRSRRTSSNQMSCALAHEPGDLVAGGAGSAHVDRQPQRIPGEDARAASAISSSRTSSPGISTICCAQDLQGRDRLGEQLLAGDRVLRRAASSEAVSSAFGLVDSTRVTERSTMLPSMRSVPRWRIADWVRLPPSLWTELRTTSAPQARALRPAARQRSAGARPTTRRRRAGPRAAWATSASPAMSATAPK